MRQKKTVLKIIVSLVIILIVAFTFILFYFFTNECAIQFINSQKVLSSSIKIVTDIGTECHMMDEQVKKALKNTEFKYADKEAKESIQKAIPDFELQINGKYIVLKFYSSGNQNVVKIKYKYGLIHIYTLTDEDWNSIIQYITIFFETNEVILSK